MTDRPRADGLTFGLSPAGSPGGVGVLVDSNAGAPPDTVGWLAERCAYCVCLSGQTSTTPWATAQGVRETIATASSTLSASISAKPATGNEACRNGRFSV